MSQNASFNLVVSKMSKILARWLWQTLNLKSINLKFLKFNHFGHKLTQSQIGLKEKAFSCEIYRKKKTKKTNGVYLSFVINSLSLSLCQQEKSTLKIASEAK